VTHLDVFVCDKVARSTTIIFVVIFSILILKKSVSKKIISCCLLVACGFFLGIDQEKALGSLSVKGVVYGVLSSIFIALTGIYTKTALDVVQKDEVCSQSVASSVSVCLSFCHNVRTNVIAGQYVTLHCKPLLVMFM